MRNAGLQVSETAAWFNAVPAGALVGGGPLRAAAEAMIAAGALSAEEVSRWDDQRRRFAQLPGATMWAPIFVTVGRSGDAHQILRPS
jgi:hypothetical protein